jgi:hypothetical protein
LPNSSLLRDIFEDLIGSLLETSSEESVFNSQPCRDNILYLLNLSHELFVDQIGIKLLVCLSDTLCQTDFFFPAVVLIHSSYPSLLQFPSPDMSAQLSSDDINSAVLEIMNTEGNGLLTR